MFSIRNSTRKRTSLIYLKMARRFNKLAKIRKAKQRAGNHSSHKKRKQQAKMKNASVHVKNLSFRSLKDAEILALSKGLNFIPNPTNKNVKALLQNDFKEFSRKLRCKYHFCRNNDLPLHPFYENTGYTPEKTCQTLETYIDKTQIELSSIELYRGASNISTQERKALHDLKNDQSIVIKKADKSNTVVIMDKKEYIKEGIRQLNTHHYESVEKPNIAEINSIIQERVRAMKEKGSLDKQTFHYLTNVNETALRPGRLYLLPKVHKLNTNQNNAESKMPPGRPIISQIGTATEKIGHYIDHFLVPIVRNQDTYIKDTTDFINKIESLKLPSSCLLISYDITSMYTNMTFPELIDAVKRALEDTHIHKMIKIPIPDETDLLFLLKCLLENNVFEFNGHYYRQIIGAAMGAVPSPEICDIRMHEITKQILCLYEHKQNILFHGRFRDDGFIIFNGNRNEAERFFTIANSIHNLLKFTYEISESSMVFLDTEIYKGNRFENSGILDIKTYIKPTNTFQYLHRSSAHNKAVFTGFIKGECIRHARNTSDKDVLRKQLLEFNFQLTKRGYSKHEIKPIIEETLSLDRQNLLQSNRNKSNTKSIPNVLVTKYDPRIKGLKNRIMKHWKSLQNDDYCKMVFKSDPIIGFSKHKNIGDMITNSTLT